MQLEKSRYPMAFRHILNSAFDKARRSAPNDHLKFLLTLDDADVEADNAVVLGGFPRFTYAAPRSVIAPL